MRFYWLFFYHSARAPVGRVLLIIEDSRSHSDITQSVGLLWTSDQRNAETSTWQTHKHPKSQQARGRRPKP